MGSIFSTKKKVIQKVLWIDINKTGLTMPCTAVCIKFKWPDFEQILDLTASYWKKRNGANASLPLQGTFFYSRLDCWSACERFFIYLFIFFLVVKNKSSTHA